MAISRRNFLKISGGDLVGIMKKIFSIIIAGFVFICFLGCDRMETAVDTYTKVKKDAQKKSQEAQEEAVSIVNKKLRDKLGPSDIGENEKEADDKDKSQ